MRVPVLESCRCEQHLDRAANPSAIGVLRCQLDCRARPCARSRVVELVGGLRQAELRDAAAERGEERAGAGVGDDDVGVRKREVLRHVLRNRDAFGECAERVDIAAWTDRDRARVRRARATPSTVAPNVPSVTLKIVPNVRYTSGRSSSRSNHSASSSSPGSSIVTGRSGWYASISSEKPGSSDRRIDVEVQVVVAPAPGRRAQSVVAPVRSHDRVDRVRRSARSRAPKPSVTWGTPRTPAMIGAANSPTSWTSRSGDHSRAIGNTASSVAGRLISPNRRGNMCAGSSCGCSPAHSG